MEKCNSCEQMKKENTATRKSLLETSKNYVEVINENLALRRQVEQYQKMLRGEEQCSNPSCRLCMQDDPSTWRHI